MLLARLSSYVRHQLDFLLPIYADPPSQAREATDAALKTLLDRGIPTFAASGDDGARDNDPYHNMGRNADFPAASPYAFGEQQQHPLWLAMFAVSCHQSALAFCQHSGTDGDHRVGVVWTPTAAVTAIFHGRSLR